MKLKGQIVALGYLLFFSSCSYRFTNLHLGPPKGIHSIAIEAIFDSSKTPIPHEILWASLQKQFAIDGRLKVTSAERADVYLRAHISKSTVTQDGVQNYYEGRDPTTIIDHGNARNPQDFQNLNRAKKFATHATITIEMDVEFWNLRTKEVLYKKSYVMGKRYEIFDARVPFDNQFLQAHETQALTFEQLSDTLAKAIVFDFLSMKS